jgi:hypothetical protein
MRFGANILKPFSLGDERVELAEYPTIPTRSPNTKTTVPFFLSHRHEHDHPDISRPSLVSFFEVFLHDGKKMR